MLNQTQEVCRVKIARLFREPARHIGVPDDGDAIFHHHGSGLCQFAIPPLFRSQINDDTTRFHGLDHTSSDELRC